jgi:glyoxylase-like metal-dependent hydrolase (beta-lactamase superfamily II)
LYFKAIGILIGGDTLFQGSIGRTDFPTSEPEAMVASLRRLLTLPDETLVYPGHGPSTTIGQERQTNPFLSELQELS